MNEIILFISSGVLSSLLLSSHKVLHTQDTLQINIKQHVPVIGASWKNKSDINSNKKGSFKRTEQDRREDKGRAKKEAGTWWE